MANLVPFFIKEKFACGEKRGEMQAYILLTDLSGFSGLTESLLKSGDSNCETLKDLVSSIFRPSVDIIHAHGGFVFTFSGDGFAAAFDKKKFGLKTVLRAVSLLNRDVSTNGLFKLPFKAGISCGRLSWEIAETCSQKVFFFEGDSIDRAAYFKSKAESGEIVLDIDFLKLDEVPEYVFVKTGSKLVLDTGKALEKEPPCPAAVLDKQLPDAGWTDGNVFRAARDGELRNVVSCYILLKKPELFRTHIGRIIQLIEQYGGYFNKAESGDKGLSLLVLFGAPAETEKPLEKAADFALSLAKINLLDFRAGISYGKAFCGIIGSEMRSEYTALGKCVNSSSKLAEKAFWGEILTDETIYNRIKTDFNLLKISELSNGHETAVPERYTLISKKKPEDLIRFEKIEMTGRKEELKKFLELAKKHREGDFWGTVCITGDPGIGKTKLIDEFKNNIVKEKYNIFRLPCEDGLRKPFQPFVRFLRDYFSISENDSEAFALVRFEDKIFSLKNKLAELCGKNSEFIKSIEYKYKWLGYLAGLKKFTEELSFYEPKEKYDNIVSSLLELLSAESFVKPVIAEVTSASQIDEDSLFVFETLFSKSRKLPFMLVLETRTIEPFTSILFGDYGEVHNIRIAPLDPQQSRDYFSSFCKAFRIENRMSRFRKSYLYTMIAKSGGNPLFIENMALFLSYKSTELPLQTEADDKLDQAVPSEIEHIILARFDNLDSDVRDSLRVASVLGQNFPKEMLLAILKEHFPEIDAIKTISLCEKHNFLESDDGSFFFTNPLIKDAIYGAQLKSFLHKVHFSAANFLEKNHVDDSSYFEEISDHFARSGFREKALEYFLKTAKFLQENYHENRALRFLENAGNIPCEKDPKTSIEILFMKGSAQKNLGKWDESSHTFREALKKAYKNRMIREYSENLESLSSLFRRTGDSKKSFSYAKRALRLAEIVKDAKLIFLANNDLGLLHYRKGEYDEALVFFEKCERILNETSDKKELSKVLNNISIIHSEKKELEEALEKALQALEICSQTDDLKVKSLVLLNLGGIYHSTNRFSEAEKYYERSLELKSRIGDRAGTVLVKCNLGVIKKDLGQLESAQKIFEDCCEINREIGNNRNLAINYINIADIKKYLGIYDEALGYYEKSIDLSRTSRLNYYLCYSLAQKTDVLYECGKYDESVKALSEAMEISKNLNNPAFEVSCELLRLKIEIKKGLSVNENLSLLESIAETAEDKFIKASAFFDLYKLTEKKDFAEKAYKIFVDLYSSVPKYEYRIYLENIREIVKNFASINE
ncbi:tetratricopeptide repeat protein [candidate division WOR-3 bacterium]|nr:tetratricopeptide repeat protein [candidate division WOR-3 bacterium]